MRDGIRMTLTLVIVCLIAGISLAFVHGQTAPVIAAQEAQALKDGLAKVVPGAASFEPVLIGDHAVVRDAWRALGADGKQVGVVIEAAPGGYGGPIRMLVGVAPDGKLIKVEILSASGETPGLGSKAVEPSFVKQYEGLQQGIALVKGRAPKGNEVQAITGATISSKAVTDGINAALEAAAKLTEGK
ncbi:MAG TPA: FMN-binding protein [Symbiobacteriaceae bacterium]|nr:FMN-binding protein [Symbiobacteriaceae bacterium]